MMFKPKMGEPLKPVVVRALVEIFLAVADAADGGDSDLLPDGVREAYADQFEKPEVQAFYNQMVSENSETWAALEEEAKHGKG
jgi:hypothetical protein